MVFTIENPTSNQTADLVTNLPLFCTPEQIIWVSKIEITPYKLIEIFMNEIRDEEKYINNKIFRENLWYQDPPFLVKDLFKVNNIGNIQIENQIIYSINELGNSVIRKEIPKNKNTNEIISIVEKSLNLIYKKI